MTHCFSWSDNLMVNTEMYNNVSPASLLFYFFGWNMERKDWQARENQSQKKIGPSFSWQDSSSFLCLSRKCKKSDFLVFHFHTHITRASVFLVCSVVMVPVGIFSLSCLTPWLYHTFHTYSAHEHKHSQHFLDKHSKFINHRSTLLSCWRLLLPFLNLANFLSAAQWLSVSTSMVNLFDKTENAS